MFFCLTWGVKEEISSLKPACHFIFLEVEYDFLTWQVCPTPESTCKKLQRKALMAMDGSSAVAPGGINSVRLPSNAIRTTASTTDATVFALSVAPCIEGIRRGHHKKQLPV